MPMVIVDELDRLKRQNQPVRGRARTALRSLQSLITDPHASARLKDPSPTEQGLIRGGVTIELVLDPPGHRRLPIADDELADRASAVQVLAGSDVTILTYDYGMAFRATTAGLIAVKLDQPES